MMPLGDHAAPLHKLQRAVRSEQQSMLNHLLSIRQDSQFVAEIITFLRQQGGRPTLPLFGNLRNGAWYSSHFDGLCYFKSTDGHDASYAFSNSRINLNVAVAAASSSGVVIVDSTRRGKRFPDSMRVTIPLWCHVMNLIVFDATAEESDRLEIRLPNWVHPSLADDIARRAAHMAESVPADIKDTIRAELCGRLRAPLEPFWVCPDSDGTIEWFAADCDGSVEELLQQCSSSGSARRRTTPVILLSCSCVEREQSPHAQHHSWHYIQGAGDDEENWAPRGLTPALFWSNAERILAAGRAEEALEAAREVAGEGRGCTTRSSLFRYAENRSVLACGCGIVNDLYASEPSLEGVVGAVERATGCDSLASLAIVVLEPPSCYRKRDVSGTATEGASTDRAASYLRARGSREVLALFASSDKRDSTVQAAVWTRQLLPAVATFCGPDRTSDNEGGGGGGSAECLLVVCADGTLAGLLAVFVRLLWSGAQVWSRAGIRSALLSYQLAAPQFSLPRRLVKVLNSYFLDGRR